MGTLKECVASHLSQYALITYETQPNIMVDGSGNARITDFGLATIIRNPHSLRSTLDGDGHTPRWCAPEILKGEQPVSKESDVFSFGMVVIEVRDDQHVTRLPPHLLMKVFTGQAPFVGNTTPVAMASIMDGKLPERPNHVGFTDSLWELTQRCLEQAPSERLNVEQVLEALRRLSVVSPFRLRILYSQTLAGKG